MTNNKQQTEMKLYTSKDLIKAIAFGFGICHKEGRAPFNKEMIEFIASLEPTTLIELPIHPLPSEEEKLDVAYGNGYEQGEMDFYKKMRGEGNKYADGYAEGYQRALELVKYRIVEQLEARQ